MRRGIRLAYSHVWNQQGCLQSSASGQTVYTALTCQQRRQLQKQANQGHDFKPHESSIHQSASAMQLSTGNILEVEGRLVRIIGFNYGQGQGRQLGNVHLQLRDIETNSQSQLRRRPSDMLEVVSLEPRSFQFLYRQGIMLEVMADDTFEQLSIPAAMLGDSAAFLKEGSSLLLLFAEDRVVSGEVPAQQTLLVSKAGPHTRGNSASSGGKTVELETGAKLSVPTFVREGDAVVVDTTTGTFVKRLTG